MTRLRQRSRPGETVETAVHQEERFAEKYRHYFPRVFAYVYGRVQNAHVAEDIVSAVFERAFVKAESLRNEEAFGTWLFTIARNVLASYCRSQVRQGQAVDSEILSAMPHGGTSVENEILLRDEIASVLKHLSRLPQREQEIVALKFDAELSNGQIARIIGITEGNVRVILFRTLRKLRDLMAVERLGSGRRKR